MSMLKSLFRRKPDPKHAMRPLWHRVVEVSRAPSWYREGTMADTVQGRFDMITLILSMLLLRMERDDALKAPSVHLTELFVDDMDGQLRETGMGDPTLGKQMGKLVSVLGGRLGALREAGHDVSAVATVVARNAAIEDDGGAIARDLLDFAKMLDSRDYEDIIAGNIVP